MAAFDVDGHQPPDEPVLRQPQHPRRHPDDGGEDAAEEGEHQRVEQPHQKRARMRAVIGVLHQSKADVVACPVPQEAEVEVAILGRQVDDGIVHQPRHEQAEQHQHDDLNGQRPESRIVDEHT
jgi:hypothetical protein